MKLFVIAALIAVSYAARLEHLEQQQQLRAYLPPGHGSFGANGQAPFGAAGAGQPGLSRAFPSASNQYLPPDHAPSAFAASGPSDFAGSLNGFSQNLPSQQYGQQAPTQQYGQAPNHFGHQDASPQGSSPFGAQTGFQQPGAQYVAPHSSQDIPQQPFDEQTGYHY